MCADDQPVARVEVVTDTRFGVSMPDPYRWLEEDTPERRAWLDGQGRYAGEYLRALPERQELADRLGELLADATPLSGFAATAFTSAVVASFSRP
jgi:prolyl oligopeptidase